MFLSVLAVPAFLDSLTTGQKALLILGVTVVAVTGMWVGLYRRGKK